MQKGSNPSASLERLQNEAAPRATLVCDGAAVLALSPCRDNSCHSYPQFPGCCAS